MTLPTTIISSPSIDISHQSIHQGNHFIVHRIATGINIANPKYFLIIPPPLATIPSNTIEVHLIFQVDSEPGGMLQFFEDPTVTNNGTVMTIINNNRRSITISLTQVYENTTVSNEGTSLLEDRKGTTTTGAVLGEFERDDEEIILNPSKKYLLKFTPLTDNTVITFELNWYDNRPSTPVP